MTKHKSNEILFLGVDQTGAIDKNRMPKPLASCLINERKVSFHYLNSFNKFEISKILAKDKNIIIAVDCILGLPIDLGLSWRESLRRVKEHPGFGRENAASFFRTISHNDTLRRKAEVLCKANSLFKTRPFQKNIQTGTYRIWKDIAQSEDDFYVPFLGETKKRRTIPIYEGYPTFSWKKIFEVKNRNPKNLKKLVQKKFPGLVLPRDFQISVNRDPNLADAFVLALSLNLFELSIDITEVNRSEGWILGLKEKQRGDLARCAQLGHQT